MDYHHKNNFITNYFDNILSGVKEAEINIENRMNYLNDLLEASRELRQNVVNSKPMERNKVIANSYAHLFTIITAQDESSSDHEEPVVLPLAEQVMEDMHVENQPAEKVTEKHVENPPAEKVTEKHVGNPQAEYMNQEHAATNVAEERTERRGICTPAKKRALASPAKQCPSAKKTPITERFKQPREVDHRGIKIAAEQRKKEIIRQRQLKLRLSRELREKKLQERLRDIQKKKPIITQARHEFAKKIMQSPAFPTNLSQPAKPTENSEIHAKCSVVEDSVKETYSVVGEVAPVKTVTVDVGEMTIRSDVLFDVTSDKEMSTYNLENLVEDYFDDETAPAQVIPSWARSSEAVVEQCERQASVDPVEVFGKLDVDCVCDMFKDWGVDLRSSSDTVWEE